MSYAIVKKERSTGAIHTVVAGGITAWSYADEWAGQLNWNKTRDQAEPELYISVINERDLEEKK